MPFATASRRQALTAWISFIFSPVRCSLHGDESGRPGDHRDGAEQDDNDHIHARRVRVILGGQVVQIDEGHGNADDGGGQAGNELIHQAEQRTMMPGIYLPER